MEQIRKSPYGIMTEQVTYLW